MDDPKTYGIPNQQTSTNSNSNKANATPYTNISNTIRAKNNNTARNVINNNNLDKYKKTNNINTNKNGRSKENAIFKKQNYDGTKSKH